MGVVGGMGWVILESVFDGKGLGRGGGGAKEDFRARSIQFPSAFHRLVVVFRIKLA